MTTTRGQVRLRRRYFVWRSCGLGTQGADPWLGLEGSLRLHAAPAFLSRLAAAHRRGQYPLEKVIRRYKFDDIGTAMHDSETGKTIKPVLVMDGQA